MLVSISPKSPYHWVFSKFLSGDYILCVTTDILQEYEEIIAKHMGKSIANDVLQIIENSSNVAYITKYYRWQLINIDFDDNKFVDCAIASNAKYIVTNDKHFNVVKTVKFPKVAIINMKSIGFKFSPVFFPKFQFGFFIFHFLPSKKQNSF